MKKKSVRITLEKHYHDAVNSLATDQEVDSARIFGLGILKYTHTELAKFIVYQAKEILSLKEKT